MWAIRELPITIQARGGANTNIWYLYNPTSLYAFAYYDDDHIPDAYGISDWVNNIPIKSVSMTTLYQRYRIFGL